MIQIESNVLTFDGVRLCSTVIFLAFLFFLAVIDFRQRKIFNKHLLVILGVEIILKCFMAYVFFDYSYLLKHVLSGVVAFSLFFLVAIVSNGGVGGGDIKLMALVGFWCGLTFLLPILFLTFFSASIYSVFLIVSKGYKAAKSTRIPLAPFVFIASLLTQLFFKTEYILKLLYLL